MNNKDILKHLISPENQIKFVIKKLGYLGKLKKNNFCLVVGKHRNILGTVTDGDIRRGLLQNYSINEKVEKIYRKKPIVTRKTLSSNQIKNILNKNGITFLPLINKKREILDIYDFKKKDEVNSINYQMLIMAGGKEL
ncbi:hypothetical protein OA180_01805 [Candidatus Pelagibacter sp.]|nr:hypothetical protein [Candidatus Pelagibacter sp.]